MLGHILDIALTFLGHQCYNLSEMVVSQSLVGRRKTDSTSCWKTEIHTQICKSDQATKWIQCLMLGRLNLHGMMTEWIKVSFRPVWNVVCLTPTSQLILMKYDWVGMFSQAYIFLNIYLYTSSPPTSTLTNPFPSLSSPFPCRKGEDSFQYHPTLGHWVATGLRKSVSDPVYMLKVKFMWLPR